ncbi:MAG: tRNA 2-thiouridine(34) synthase MnmA [Eubacteriales bacterium]|nr:tRNA 2-thiouridine(34) synthase MnmA [Eubacteriales bacterium]
MNILAAMSGGVDSSVTAYLLQSQGHNITGVTMKLFDKDNPIFSMEKSCCTDDNIQDAREVCNRLGIDYHVVNFTDDFKSQVIDRFVHAYENGATPNPCVDCNRHMKFKRLLKQAEEMNLDAVATGHYAQVKKVGDRYLVMKGTDESKDQSYVLYSLTQEQLSRTILPIGELTKNQVREIAQEQGFINANKKDSQDICFVPDGDYAGLIRRISGKAYPKGDFVDLQGNILGQHNGIIHYTIGQRKGLGIAFGEPKYVCGIHPQSNEVILGSNDDLFITTVVVDNVNFIACDSIDAPIKAEAKIRYNHTQQPATITQTGENQITIVFDQPQRAATPGQSAVVYDGNIVICGGTII